MSINRAQYRSLLTQAPFIDPKSATPYWPSAELGIGVAPENDYSMLRVLNDRAFQLGPNNGIANNPAGGFYNLNYTPINGIYNLPASSQDPTTGMPLTAFCIKLCEGAPQATPDPSVVGTWAVVYSAAAQVTCSGAFGAVTITSSTFAAGSGLIQFSYSASAPLGLNFSGPVTALHVYAPDSASTAIAGGTPGRFTTAYLQSVAPYAYLRMMDVVYANQDFVNLSNTTWASVVNWSDRATEANIQASTLIGRQSGLPLEWQIDLCNQSGKSGWFNLPALASDDYVTRHATMVAQLLGAGKYAVFELSNERWNFAGGFYNYKKTGVAGMLEAKAAQPGFSVSAASITSFSSNGTTATVTCAGQHAGVTGTYPSFVGLQSGYMGFAPTGPLTVVSDSTTHVYTYPCSQPSTGGNVAGTTVLGATGFQVLPISEWSATQYQQCIVSVSSDGVAPGFAGATSTAILKFSQPHGATTGMIPLAGTMNTGYTGFKPVAGSTLTVVDAYTVSYPCTQAATATVIPGITAFPINGIFCCDSSGTLFTGNHIAQVYDLGKYWFHRRQFQVAQLVRAAYTAVGRSLNDCITIQMWGANAQYSYDLTTMQSYILSVFGQPLSPTFTAASMGAYFNLDEPGGLNSGFGLVNGVGTPANQAALLAQLRVFVDHCYGAYNYPAFIGFCKQASLIPMIYEAGVDTSTYTGAGGSSGSVAGASNIDPLMEGLCRDWVWNLERMGFQKVGWYHGGCNYQSGGGCFNLGTTAASINPATASGSQAPKFRGLLDALSAPGTPNSYHEFPCTLSGFDIVGNEAAKTVANVSPSLSGANMPAVNGSGMGYTMKLWSEAARTIAVTMNGHTTTTAQTITVTVLGGASGTFTTPPNAGSVTQAVCLGGCLLAIPAGLSYIQFTSAGAAGIFSHSVQFS